MIVHKDYAYSRARIVQETQRSDPATNVSGSASSAVGGKILARETIRAIRKDVLSKCYAAILRASAIVGKTQKEGKRRMKRFGNVEIPQEALWRAQIGRRELREACHSKIWRVDSSNQITTVMLNRPAQRNALNVD